MHIASSYRLDWASVGAVGVGTVGVCTVVVVTRAKSRPANNLLALDREI